MNLNKADFEVWNEEHSRFTSYGAYYNYMNTYAMLPKPVEEQTQEEKESAHMVKVELSKLGVLPWAIVRLMDQFQPAILYKQIQIIHRERAAGRIKSSVEAFTRTTIQNNLGLNTKFYFEKEAQAA
jgi:hypothetical protein